jgi:hypothetical protein
MAYELEDEMELEDELEDEQEEELGNLLSGLLGEGEDEFEDEDEQEEELGSILGSLLGEGEGEDEFEDELEDEISPTRKIYPDAMMEHLGELAAEAETEDEAAEHFLPLVGMAASKLLPVVAKAIAPAAKKMLPKIARAVTKATPHLTKGIAKVARSLHHNPRTRHLLKVVPAIARRTVGSVARQAAHGRRVTPHAAVRTLAKSARRVLAHPAHRKHALQHHHRLERTLHHRYGKGIRHPHMHLARGKRYLGRRHYGHLKGRPLLRGGVPGAGLVRRRGATLHGPGGVATRYGRAAGGTCRCPSCGSAARATPAYCRCCGQPLR